MRRETLLAVVMAGLGIVLGNTVADFTNDFDGRIFGGSSTPSVTFTCTPNE